jgi:hypothetical protein
MLRVIRPEAGEEPVRVLRLDRKSSDPKQEKNEVLRPNPSGFFDHIPKDTFDLTSQGAYV